VSNLTIKGVISATGTGTRTMLFKLDRANKRLHRIPLIAIAGTAAVFAAYRIYSYIERRVEIGRMIDPAATCEDVDPAGLAQRIPVIDLRNFRSEFTPETVRDILLAVDPRFTSGISRAEIVGIMQDGNGQRVAGDYNIEDQSITASTAASVTLFRASEMIFHEVGHHVFWKLQEKGHDSINGFGSNEDQRFAQVFSYYCLRAVSTDWEHFNSYKLTPPTAEEMAWLKDNLFCGQSPETWYLDKPWSLQLMARLFVETKQPGKLRETLLRLSQFPDSDYNAPDLRQYIAILDKRYYQIDPGTFLAELGKLSSLSPQVGITRDMLNDLANYFIAFNNRTFADQILRFAAENFPQ
jgi:hypothetical protein